MLIDHIAWAFVPTLSVLGQIMHFIGRLTGPTMAFFIAEGYRHTRDVKKYASRMALFALISWLPFTWFEMGGVTMKVGGLTLLNPTPQSVIYTLLLALLAIWLWDKGKCSQGIKVLGIIGLCALSAIGDWAIFAILYSLNFYVNRENRRSMWINYALISSLVAFVPITFMSTSYEYIFQLGVFMVPLFVGRLYNGESGKKSAFNKWFFYVFYPLHLLVLCIIKYVIL